MCDSVRGQGRAPLEPDFHGKNQAPRGALLFGVNGRQRRIVRLVMEMVGS